MDSRRLCWRAQSEAGDARWAGKKCKHTAWPDHLRKEGRQVSIVHIHARRLGTSSRARMRTCKDALHDLHLVGRQPTRHLRQLVCALLGLVGLQARSCERERL